MWGQKKIVSTTKAVFPKYELYHLSYGLIAVMLSVIIIPASLWPSPRSRWQEKEAKLRRTVTRVLRCDVTKTPPLGSAQVPLADCVLTFLAMECACPDVDTYRAALRRLAGLLKPGGHLVTLVTLRFQHYMVGPKKFSGVYLEKETVEKAIQDAGCQVLRCNCVPLSYSEAYCVNDGLCFVVARKGPSV